MSVARWTTRTLSTNVWSCCLFSVVGVTGFEVNFMDDVGQTLLNWASAFGTQEMVSQVKYFTPNNCQKHWIFLTSHHWFFLLKVEFLCERGADVNRGLRSSSLHYAACFGRPQIVKVIIWSLCSLVFDQTLSVWLISGRCLSGRFVAQCFTCTHQCCHCLAPFL